MRVLALVPACALARFIERALLSLVEPRIPSHVPIEALCDVWKSAELCQAAEARSDSCPCCWPQCEESSFKALAA